LIPLVGLTILAILHNIDYLAFHITAELFSAIVGALAFIIAVNTWRFTHNSFLYTYGAGSLFVAVTDLTHAITYKGMNLIPSISNDTNTATQFWLDGRYLEAITLLLSVLALRHGIHWRPAVIFTGLGLTTLLLYIATVENWFPAAWIPNQGLTPFKIGSEYLVMAIFVIVLVMLFHSRSRLATDTYRLIFAAVTLMVATEICFTLYGDVYGPFNMVGHYMKFLTFWVIYLAIVRSTLRQPFTSLSASAHVFDTMPSPVFVLNEYGWIRQANHAAAEALETTAAALERQRIQNLPLIFPFDLITADAIRTLSKGDEVFNDTVHSRDGEQGYAMHLVPLHWPGSDAVAVLTLTDITTTLEARRATARSEERYRSVVNALSEGVVMQEASGRIVTTNPAAEQILGLSRTHLQGRTSENAWDAIHEDGTPFPGNTHPAMVALRTGQPQQGIVMGLAHDHLHTRWLNVNSIPLFHTDEEKPYAVVSAFEDITESRNDREALRIARKQLATVIAHFSSGLLLEDDNRRLILANQAFCDLFGIEASPDTLVGIDCTETAEQAKSQFADPDHFVRRIKALMAAKKTVLNEECRMADGRTLERDYIAIFDNHRFVGHLWKYRNISEHKNLEKSLESLAMTDVLTGVANRRAFDELLAREYERLARYQHRPAAVLMLDLDHFKKINDTYGHSAGDAMLRHFSHVLQRELRKVDTLARVGGEEFAILLPETDFEGAMQFAERLRRAVASSSLMFGGKRLHITTCIGVAPLTVEDITPHAALERADDALYRAKEAVRDRVAIAAEEKPD